MLRLCLFKNSFPCLVKSKPVKQEVSHTVIIPFTKKEIINPIKLFWTLLTTMVSVCFFIKRKCFRLVDWVEPGLDFAELIHVDSRQLRVPLLLWRLQHDEEQLLAAGPRFSLRHHPQRHGHHLDCEIFRNWIKRLPDALRPLNFFTRKLSFFKLKSPIL